MNAKLIETAVITALNLCGYEAVEVTRSSVCKDNTNVYGINVRFGMKPERMHYELDLTYEGYKLIWIETASIGVSITVLDTIKQQIKKARKELRK